MTVEGSRRDRNLKQIIVQTEATILTYLLIIGFLMRSDYVRLGCHQHQSLTYTNLLLTKKNSKSRRNRFFLLQLLFTNSLFVKNRN
jgi:hypothetical protein